MRTLTRPGLPVLSSNLPGLVAEVGTPFYVYDWETLRSAAKLLLDAIDEAGIGERSTLFLAFFALPNLPLFKRVLEIDPRLGITCNTPEELIALREWGWTDWEHVVFSGGVLPRRDLELIARTGCLINVASRGNLQFFVDSSFTNPVGLRLDFSDSALKGIRMSELGECVRLAHTAGRPVDSLHAYPGTEIRDLSRLTFHARQLLKEAGKSSHLRHINFGGGFWYDYDHLTGDIGEMVSFIQYFTEVRRLAEEYLGDSKTTLCWEPGRVAFAGAGFFVTEVIEVRNTPGMTLDVYVDGSFTQIPSPKLRARQHRVIILKPDGRVKQGDEYLARICGATTLSTDQLVPDMVRVPAVCEGDYVVILDVGAYGRGGSYNFLGKARPPEVLQSASCWELLRGRQRLNHLMEDLTIDIPRKSENLVARNI